jgi:mannitol operon transcriptional antiterminator
MCLQSNYTTISDIASLLGVSSRTVLRELPTVESWLKSKGFSLDKKTGVGIRINGSIEEKRVLIDMINQEEGEIIYSPEERQTIIISELLKSQQPAKLYNFTRMLKVTEGTISNDLDKVDERLNKNGIPLVRKPGLGVYIKGNEKNIRKAIADLIYENIGEDGLLAMLRNNLPQHTGKIKLTKTAIKNRLLNLIDEDTIKKLMIFINSIENNIGYRLADSAYIELIVHVAIAIQRIRKKQSIKIDEKILNELKKSKEFITASELCKQISALFSIFVEEDEIAYIAMHIKGSKNQEVINKGNNKLIGNYELVKLSKEIIKIAESHTGQFLGHNDKLLVGLVNHLGPAISRLKMNMEIRNPLLEEVKGHNKYLYELGEKCSVVIEKMIDKKMPESEIAYIAMHLGAAIENSEASVERVYRVAIACVSGIGTSRLLATRIQKEYNNIEIIDIISTIHLEDEWIKNKGIDFIISSVKMLSTSVPVVTVNPLLFEEDKVKISKQIKLLENTTTMRPIERKSKLLLKEKVEKLMIYGESITQILDNFFLDEDNISSNIDEVITAVSKKIASDEEIRSTLEEAIRTREEKGGTFLTGLGLLLLHCRTSAVHELHFGAVRPRNEINFINGKNESEQLELIVIMLAPENCSKYFIETISYVSRMLVERLEFTDFLKRGIAEKSINILNSILEEFYRNKFNKYMEG